MRQIILFTAVSVLLACHSDVYTEEQQRELNREQADRLHDRAVGLQGNRRRASRVADLHRQSARLRPAGDPRAFDCYAEASQVLAAAGRVQLAREYMEEAAAFALSRADSLTAARAYVEAIRLAAEAGVPERVLELGDRLRALTGTRAEFRSLNEAAAPALAAAQQEMTTSERSSAR